MKQRLAGSILLFPFILSAQSFVEKFEADDISAAIKLLGIEIFKYDFSKQQNREYNLVISVEEIVNGSVTQTKSYNLGKWQEGQTNKKLTIISKVASDTASAYWIKLSHPNMETTERFTFPPEFRKIHFWKQIVSGEIVYNKKVPLLFYGTGWEAILNGRKVLRFCWGEDVTRDMTNPTLKKIDHMVLISYELMNK